jgi:hypothetical protein
MPGDLRHATATLALFPMLELALRAVSDYETVGWVTQTAAVLVIAAVLFAVQDATHADVRANRITAATTFLFAFLAYGYGAAIHINALADSDIQQTRYVRREKYGSTGKAVRYKVRLNRAHLDAPEAGSAEGTPYFYDRNKPGDAVCLASGTALRASSGSQQDRVRPARHRSHWAKLNSSASASRASRRGRQ